MYVTKAIKQSATQLLFPAGVDSADKIKLINAQRNDPMQ